MGIQQANCSPAPLRTQGPDVPWLDILEPDPMPAGSGKHSDLWPLRTRACCHLEDTLLYRPHYCPEVALEEFSQWATNRLPVLCTVGSSRCLHVCLCLCRRRWLCMALGTHRLPPPHSQPGVCSRGQAAGGLLVLSNRPRIAYCLVAAPHIGDPFQGGSRESSAAQTRGDTLPFSLARSPETGERGSDLSPAEAFQHR